jgi:hypothetical protein
MTAVPQRCHAFHPPPPKHHRCLPMHGRSRVDQVSMQAMLWRASYDKQHVSDLPPLSRFHLL